MVQLKRTYQAKSKELHNWMGNNILNALFGLSHLLLCVGQNSSNYWTCQLNTYVTIKDSFLFLIDIDYYLQQILSLPYSSLDLSLLKIFYED